MNYRDADPSLTAVTSSVSRFRTGDGLSGAVTFGFVEFEPLQPETNDNQIADSIQATDALAKNIKKSQ